MATIDLDELRKEIEADRKSLAEKEAVLRFLESRESQKGSTPTKAVVITPPTGVIQINSLVPEVKRRTLASDVHDVISRFGNQEFTVVHVEAALKQLGVEFKGDTSPRPRISTILGKLEDAGVIDRTFEGKGNVPNRYKLKEHAHDLI